METAAGLKRLAEIYELTHEQVGAKVGKSREYVSNYLRLLNLSFATVPQRKRNCYAHPPKAKVGLVFKLGEGGWLRNTQRLFMIERNPARLQISL